MSSEQNGDGPAPEEPGPEARPAPRTLAEDLRARDDAALAALLRARPDLLSPVPGDLTQLATRAGTRASVVRALEGLDRFTLQTAEALAVAPPPGAAGPTVRESLATLLPGEEAAERLPRALDELRARALVWGDGDGGGENPRLVRTARELLGSPSPTGLGPPLAEAVGTARLSPARLQEILGAAGLPATHDPVSAVSALTSLFTDPDRMSALLDGAPEGAVPLLRKLEWGPPHGTVDVANPSRPVGWLLDRALLVPAGPGPDGDRSESRGERADRSDGGARGGTAAAGTVVLPREVALHLRGGRAHREPQPVPPAVAEERVHPPETVDAAAAGQALAALATVEELLGHWETEPPPVLRAGGLGVRDLRRAAGLLDVPEQQAAFWAELAYAAGLVASDGEVDEAYAPTPAYDDWLRAAPPERWALLAAAWLAATRVAGPVGERDTKGKALAALGPGLDRGPAPDVRHRTLTLLAGLPPGTRPDRASLHERLRWERPLQAHRDPHRTGRRPADGTDRGPAPAPAPPDTPPAAEEAPVTLRDRLAHWTLEEAELLGVTGRGALASFARPLLGPTVPGERAPAAPGTAPAAAAGTQGGAAEALRNGRPREEQEAEAAEAVDRAARALAPLVPEPLTEVLLQADLTAVAPGPLERELSAFLGLMADVESKGGATVYRFTPESVRRALDAGRSAADLHSFLAGHSRTPVPQPLTYLIDDVARRHGRLRVGAASSYLRCDDDALLAGLLADRRAAPLRLRMLAPTVLASAAPPDQLLARLREMGYAPAAESAEGDVLLGRPDVRRTPPRRPPEPVPDRPPLPDAALLTAAVRAIRAGDHAATLPHKPKAPASTPPDGGLPRTVMADTLATMQSATLTGTPLWIGYVNADGAASQRVIAPVKVEGGFVTAYDHTADEVRTYPLHRITGVAEITED
ncbi:helicase-associated domain-containing protein [Streptomyces sp. NRRL S-1868]|uniref:helicase-associated domain-containing protein n=1 Tax=Streptomyces sp. NRRL S-1868 TaxID=1463892 RepID=UPI0004C7DD41